MNANTVRIDLVKVMEDRIKQLDGYFNAPEIVLALYEGERVSVLVGRPITTEPLTYPALYVDGDKAGIKITVTHDALTFIDPVVVTTQGYIQGLTDRIKELEEKTSK